MTDHALVGSAPISYILLLSSFLVGCESSTTTSGDSTSNDSMVQTDFAAADGGVDVDSARTFPDLGPIDVGQLDDGIRDDGGERVHHHRLGCRHPTVQRL